MLHSRLCLLSAALLASACTQALSLLARSPLTVTTCAQAAQLDPNLCLLSDALLASAGGEALACAARSDAALSQVHAEALARYMGRAPMTWEHGHAGCPLHHKGAVPCQQMHTAQVLTAMSVATSHRLRAEG